MNKRGQFEILGIAIFIVIVIIGIAIFIMLPDNTIEDPAAAYEAEQLSQTLVDTMLRVQMGPNCPMRTELTYYDLIRVHVLGQLEPCGPLVVDSKVLLKDAADEMIKAATGSNFEFAIYVEDPSPTDIVRTGDCSGARSKERSGIERIPMGYNGATQVVIVELQLCGN